MEPQSPNDVKMKTNLCIRLKVKKLGLRRRVDPSQMQEDADTELLHVSKDILDSKSLRAITAVLSHAKSHVRDHRAFPVSLLRGGIYPLPTMLLDEVDQYLRETDERVQVLAHNFAINEYAQAKDKARARLEPMKLFDETEYPSVVAVSKAFGLKWSFFTITVPEAVKDVSAAVYARENAKLEAEYADMRQEMRAILRAQAASFVTQLANALSLDESGKRKKIRATVGQKLADFCAVFPFRNIDDDESLAEQVGKIRDLLSDVDVVSLKTNAMLCDTLAFEFSEIADDLGKLVEEAPLRKFNLNHDTQEAIDVQS